MNILLWVLQVLAALLYGSSGVMKVFMFDKITQDFPSFGALPREAWMTLGILELVCTVGLIVPAAFHWQPRLTILAATLLAVESLLFLLRLNSNVWFAFRYAVIRDRPQKARSATVEDQPSLIRRSLSEASQRAAERV